MIPRPFLRDDRHIGRAGPGGRCGLLVKVEPHAIREGKLVLGVRDLEVAVGDDEVSGTAFGDAADLRRDSEDVRGIARESCQRRVGGKARRNRLPDVVPELRHGEAVGRKRELHAGLVQLRGTGHFKLSDAFAVFPHAHGQVRFAIASGGKVESQNHGHVAGLQSVGHFPGVAAAHDNRLQLELFGKVESPVNLIRRVGFKGDWQFAFECGPKCFQARVGEGSLPGAATSFKRRPLPLQPTGIEHRLPIVSDDTHERAGIIAAHHTAEASVKRDRPAKNRIAGYRATQTHEGARSREVAAIRRDEMRREPDPTPGSDGIFIELQRGLNRELGREPLAVVWLGRDQRIGGDFLHGRRPGERTAQRRVEAARAARIQESRIDREPFPFRHEGIGRDSDIGADRDDQPIADHDRGLLDDGARLDDDPRIANRVGRRFQVGGILCRDERRCRECNRNRERTRPAGHGDSGMG